MEKSLHRLKVRRGKADMRDVFNFENAHGFPRLVCLVVVRCAGGSEGISHRENSSRLCGRETACPEEQLRDVASRVAPGLLAHDDGIHCRKRRAAQHQDEGRYLCAIGLESSRFDRQCNIARRRLVHHVSQCLMAGRKADQEPPPILLLMRAAYKQPHAGRQTLRRILQAFHGEIDTRDHLMGQRRSHICEQILRLLHIVVDRSARHAGRLGEFAD